MTPVTPATPVGLDHVRTIADAVLYEGYLLYPYRASSHKNQSRWQFGVLGPPGAAPGSFAEEPGMAMQALLADPDEASAATAEVTVRLRFLQLQVREVQRREEDGSHTAVGELTVAGVSVLSWDEAVECEVDLGAVPLGGQAGSTDELRTVPGGEETEPLTDEHGRAVGRVVRRREPLAARIRTRTERDDGYLRLSVSVDNEHTGTATDKDAAIRASSSARTCSSRPTVPTSSPCASHPRRRPAPPPGANSAGAGRSWPGRRAPGTPCWARRSSSTTTRRSPNRAPAPCSTPPRSTRS